MSHWYEYPPIKKDLEKVKSFTNYRYEHRGEALTVFDSSGCLTVLTSLDKGMDFVRIAKSVRELWEQEKRSLFSENV